MDKKFYLTKEGLIKLKNEYETLKKLRLSKLKGESPRIFHSDDVSNEYLMFKEDLNLLESRIFELEYIFKNYFLIKKPPKEKQDIVDIGATVTLEDEDGEINEFMIVGTLEANPSEGKISTDSPVGKALLGKKVGDEITITSPINVKYKIKKIRYEIS
jgi:transcription elongation factor GreA